MPDRDELGGVRIGQRAKQDTVDHAEDGSVRADTYGKGYQDDGGEEGRAGERARRIAHVAGEVVDPRQATLIAQGVHRLRHRAMSNRRRSSSVGSA